MAKRSALVMRRGNPTQVRILWPAPFIEAWDISRPLALGARAGLGSTGRLDHYLEVGKLAKPAIISQVIMLHWRNWQTWQVQTLHFLSSSLRWSTKKLKKLFTTQYKCCIIINVRSRCVSIKLSAPHLRKP